MIHCRRGRLFHFLRTPRINLRLICNKEICNTFLCFSRGCDSWANLHLRCFVQNFSSKKMCKVLSYVNNVRAAWQVCLTVYAIGSRAITTAVHPMIVDKWTASNQNATFIYLLWHTDFQKCLSRDFMTKMILFTLCSQFWH